MTSRLLIDEPPLLVIPRLAKSVGLNEAIFLQQVHYWLNPKHNGNFFEGRFWVYNTYEQWSKQLAFCSVKTVRRTIANLETQGLLLSFTTKDFKKTKYYTLDYERLDALLTRPDVSFEEEALLSGDSHTLSEGKTHPSSIIPFKRPEIPEFFRSGQNDPLDQPKRADRWGQNDPIDEVNLTRCYNKDTETPLQRIPPPLSPPPLVGEVKNDFSSEKEKTTLSPQASLIEVWNEEVQSRLRRSRVSLTSERAKKLDLLLKELFNNDPDQWKSYCRSISERKFLMGGSGSGFVATLDWALDPKNAQKVLEGAIYDKPSSSHVCSQPFDAFLTELKKQSHAISPSAPEVWFEVGTHLAKIKSPVFVKSWLWDIKVECSENKVLITTPTPFRRDWLEQHVSSLLHHAFARVSGQSKEILFKSHPSSFLRGTS